MLVATKVWKIGFNWWNICQKLVIGYDQNKIGHGGEKSVKCRKKSSIYRPNFDQGVKNWRKMGNGGDVGVGKWRSKKIARLFFNQNFNYLF